MVNYNNDTTIATPSVDINRVQVLERRAYVIEALENYYTYQFNGARGNDGVIRARISSLFWELQETLSRKFSEAEYKEMQTILFDKSSKLNKVLYYWNKINMMLGEINLTKIDTRKEYDTTDVELENGIHGM